MLMGISRLYFYVHFPTDVLAGAGLGLVCGFLAALLVRKIQSSQADRDYL